MKYVLLIHQGTHPRPRHGRVGEALGGRAEGGSTPTTRRSTRPPASPPRLRLRRARDRDDRPRGGRQDADHRRPVRRRQGGDRRLAHLRGRRPRRRDRARVAHPGGSHGRRDRDPPGGGGLAILEQVFRDEWGRVLASLIGFLGDFDLAEEAAQEAFAIAAERWPREGTPDNPRAWLVTTARNRAIDRIRRDRDLAEKTRLLDVRRARGGRGGRDDDSRRAARAALHLLSPGARARGPGRADAADARRPDHRGDRPRLPGPEGDDGQAAGPGEAQDQGRRDPVPRAARPSAARPPRGGAGGRLPDLQRGLRRPRRPRRRGDPARTGRSPS